MACPDENLLALLAQGQLGTQAMLALEPHLGSCAACRRQVAELVRADAPDSPRGHNRDVLLTGAAIGRFVVLEAVGAGSMGIVYAAYDPKLDRRVALKLIRAGDDSALRVRLRERLLREAQAMARLSDPHVIAVHDMVTLSNAFVSCQPCESSAWVGAFSGPSSPEARSFTLDFIEKQVCSRYGQSVSIHVFRCSGISHLWAKPDLSWESVARHRLSFIGHWVHG